MILVDGHSTDDTIAVARALCPDIRIVPQPAAARAPRCAQVSPPPRGDIIVMLDADGSTDPAEIPAFVARLLAGADFVKGSRFLQAAAPPTCPSTAARQLGLRAIASRVLFGGRFSDLCYGYNAFWRAGAAAAGPGRRRLRDRDDDERPRAQAGLKVAEVPSFEAERIYGESNLHALPDGWRVLKTLIKERLTDTMGVSDSVGDNCSSDVAIAL